MASRAPPPTPVLRPTVLDTPIPHLSLGDPAREIENIAPGAKSPVARADLRDDIQRLAEILANLSVSESPTAIKQRRPRKALGELGNFNEQKR